MGLSLKRLESTALRELSIILNQDSKNEHLRHVIVTEVRITNDLSFMKVYYTFYQGKVENFQKYLEDAKGYLRSTLAKKLQIRKMPELIFVHDDSLATGNRIDEMLRDLNKN
ncbi:MAG: 30S ribosome-binding factor RbfA [Acholeplasmatales bacterium]|nr:30S ribosome-binding factor RbfA [Acholeplasmatales bacterium]